MSDKIAAVIVPAEDAPEHTAGDAVVVGILVRDRLTRRTSVTLAVQGPGDSNHVSPMELMAVGIEALRLAVKMGGLPQGVTQQTVDYVTSVYPQLFEGMTIDA